MLFYFLIFFMRKKGIKFILFVCGFLFVFVGLSLFVSAVLTVSTKTKGNTWSVSELNQITTEVKALGNDMKALWPSHY